MTHPGTAWLLSWAPNPTDVQRAWNEDEFAPIPSNGWTVVEAPCLRSLEAMRPLARGGELGPVLVDLAADVAWWLVADGADEHLADLPMLTVRPPGWALRCPPADQYFNGRGWLEKPDGDGKLTDPIKLGAAFGPGGRLPAEAFG
ncbi:hypothetical protein [Streptomyces noursei]|uniref:hypothetical protein n=1 Tax=Streptomyces noursei TaxID=1971 RepID=UPI0016719D1D|nr:hypothetical protein [Streptomyces noursei]MCZ1013926.1 hypothetical protein [Streptomyces noursei]GGX40823.1 hypothetical protein GCM10010341_73490 [Streptomyces noursei]